LNPQKGDAALMRHVRKAGCASKISQADLQRIVGALPQSNDPRVLLGTAAGDDAGVFALDDERALVQTVDVFTPCVDDAYLFGKIAAANSLSDVYAMGGTPLTALSIVGFPIDILDDSHMTAMLEGGIAKLDEANCRLLGGHSINDEEIKCGYAITGMVSRKMFVERDRAQPGDVLILTKPLGTGIVSFAAQLGLVDAECMTEVGEWMAAFNKDAAELMTKYGAHACTDVTGFGLAGHLVAMVRGSGVNAEIDLAKLPVFAMAAECVEKDVFGGAVDRNQAYAMAWVEMRTEDAESAVLYDAQTSGGLLIAMPENAARCFLDEMRSRGNRVATTIGRITEKDRGEGRVIVLGGRSVNLFGKHHDIELKEHNRMSKTDESMACCGDAENAADASCCDSPSDETHHANALPSFKGFMKEAMRPGAIDARTKKLIAISLSIVRDCKPCLKIHVRAALDMGITKAEIDEAAVLAVVFGGGPSMMFYNETCREIGLD